MGVLMMPDDLIPYCNMAPEEIAKLINRSNP